MISMLGCARTVTSLDIVGNEVQIEINTAETMVDGSRFYLVFSTTETQIEFPQNEGDYFFGPGENDDPQILDDYLEDYDGLVSSMNVYYQRFFDSWADYALIHITSVENRAAEINIYNSSSTGFSSTVTNNTDILAKTDFSYEFTFSSSTKFVISFDLDHLSNDYAVDAPIYFAFVSADTVRGIGDILDGTYNDVSNLAGAQESGTDSSGDVSNSGLDLRGWVVSVR